MSKLDGFNDTAFQGVSKTSVGYKLIANMGWKEGEGLGLNKAGIKRHLRTEKRTDRGGLGLDRGEIREKTWERNCLVFDEVLSRLTEIKSNNDSTVHREDESHKQKKPKKKSKQSHLKRYLRQKRSKLVKCYSEADLTAILGQSRTDPPSPVSISDTKDSVEEQKSSCEKNEWWSGLFVRAGTLEKIQNLKNQNSSKEDRKNVEKFSEQDQEDLYCKVQQTCSKSRQGLGRSTELKIGGVRANQGTRTTFSESENDLEVYEEKEDAIKGDLSCQEVTPPDVQSSKKKRKKAKLPTLNLTDNYELVGGIPTFVWRPKRDYKPSFRLFAFSSDGSRMAIVEGARHIRVYSVTNGFSLVAEEFNVGTDFVVNLMFYLNHNERLIVMFVDSTIAVLSISTQSRRMHRSGTGSRVISRGIIPVESHQLIEVYEDKLSLLFASERNDSEIWICGWDRNVENVLNLCSITQEVGFRRTRIKSRSSVLPSNIFMSIPARALMGITTFNGDVKFTRTKIWQEIDFDRLENKEEPFELQGHGFGWDHFGKYFLIWNLQLDGESKIELYYTNDLKFYLPNPKITRHLNFGVLSMKAQFHNCQSFLQRVMPSGEMPIISYLIIKPTEIILVVWDTTTDDFMKEINVTMKEVWYFAQAFQQTGALVLMIENVARDCIFFLILAALVLISFSFALFNLFQHILHNAVLPNTKPESPRDDDLANIIKRSYGNPIKAMLTLFYAMVGEFNIEIYSGCGGLSPLIVLIFLIYLGVQMIVMLNMLIAVMGDTFDRVKDTEEEQLLMGRARFIDACEAMLASKQIEELERNVKKHLYVLCPTQENLQDGRLWHGRVKTLEDRVKNIVTQSQDQIIEKMKELDEHNKQRIYNLKKTIVKIEDDITMLKDKIK
eukprot:g8622.t1